jgi:selenocysteine-specific elongation factor
MLPVSARPGGADSQALDADDEPPIGMDALKSTLLALIPEVSVKRESAGSFLFAVDHCFPVKGVGTVLTGTTLRGEARVGDSIEIPHLKVEKKIKSMQMFKKPVDSCARGDRLGICVAGLDAKVLERGLVCAPGTVPTFHAAVVSARKIRFFKSAVRGGSKFHVTIGHSTVMASVQFFGDVPKSGENALVDGLQDMSLDGAFDAKKEYKFCEELLTEAEAKQMAEEAGAVDDSDPVSFAKYALLEFDQPITVPTDELFIASRFDTDIHQNTCRLAFHGRMLRHINTEHEPDFIRNLRVFKMKSREGSIERVQDERSVIGKGMFKKESDLTAFIGMKVWTSNNDCGVIEGGFGKSGKYKVYFSNGIKGEGLGKLILRFKKYVFEHGRNGGSKMEQGGLE